MFDPLSRRHGCHEVFRDFVEMMAIAISNSLDPLNYETREARYHEVIKRYTPDEMQVFPQALAELTMALEVELHDALGQLFNELELSNHYAGQFFTPYDVSKAMALVTVDEGMKRQIEREGYITVLEPACGSGGMVVALAETMLHTGINYQESVHVTAVDTDIRCVHMAYIQLSLLHVPALVLHGNSLSMETYSVWRTPAHVLGFWEGKVKARV